jgi:hypothetical protein
VQRGRSVVCARAQAPTRARPLLMHLRRGTQPVATGKPKAKGKGKGKAEAAEPAESSFNKLFPQTVARAMSISMLGWTDEVCSVVV